MQQHPGLERPECKKHSTPEKQYSRGDYMRIYIVLIYTGIKKSLPDVGNFCEMFKTLLY